MRKLPSLNYLRAFEAAARLGGVYKAAQELCVTHGAVSRQIKQLEQWLGVELFERSGRSVVLNAQGKAYLVSISAALDLVEQASVALLPKKETHTIGISTTHSIASKWLIDKLKHYPQGTQAEVWLNLEQGCTDFKTSGVDIALRMGAGPWPNLHCIPLMADRLIVVASPSLIENVLSSPQLLSNFDLLHDQDPSAQWVRLFSENQLELIDLSKGMRMSSTDLLLSSAINGQGVALVSERLAYDDILAGKLKKVLDESVNLGTYYWLVMPRESILKPKVNLFCEWLKKVCDDQKEGEVNI